MRFRDIGEQITHKVLILVFFVNFSFSVNFQYFFPTVLPPEGTAEQQWSNSGAEPSVLCSMMRVSSRRNHRRKVKTDRLPVFEQQQMGAAPGVESGLEPKLELKLDVHKEVELPENRLIREGWFQPVYRNYICPVPKLKAESFVSLSRTK